MLRKLLSNLIRSVLFHILKYPAYFFLWLEDRKKRNALCILLILMTVTGCQITPRQHSLLNDYARQQLDLQYNQNMQLRQNADFINRQIRMNNSWQERRARQQYLSDWYK